MKLEHTVEPELKQQIDNMQYIELLRIWRFSPSGTSQMLQGATGHYFAKEMFRKKEELTHAQQVFINKIVGW